MDDTLLSHRDDECMTECKPLNFCFLLDYEIAYIVSSVQVLSQFWPYLMLGCYPWPLPSITITLYAASVLSIIHQHLTRSSRPPKMVTETHAKCLSVFISEYKL